MLMHYIPLLIRQISLFHANICLKLEPKAAKKPARAASMISYINFLLLDGSWLGDVGCI